MESGPPFLQLRITQSQTDFARLVGRPPTSVYWDEYNLCFFPEHALSEFPDTSNGRGQLLQVRGVNVQADLRCRCNILGRQGRPSVLNKNPPSNSPNQSEAHPPQAFPLAQLPAPPPKPYPVPSPWRAPPEIEKLN